jgi:hypothetical protein
VGRGVLGALQPPKTCKDYEAWEREEGRRVWHYEDREEV